MAHRHLLLLLLAVSIVSETLYAQISLGGTPMSQQLGLSTQGIEVARMHEVDVDALLREDIERANYNVPYRFAHGFQVELDNQTAGTWVEFDNGDRLWRLLVTSKGAHSINFLYDDFYLPEGSSYYIYAADGSEMIGAFGSHNNRPSRKFATGLVHSESVVLEYYEPAEVAGQGSISISQVAHGYRSFAGYEKYGQAEGLGNGGSCQVNINCPEGANWQVEKKAVARIIINGIETCTGTLINNVANNCTPYFLTAQHCIDGSYDAVTNPNISGAVFYWNYERSGCDNTGSVPNETTAGATVVANAAPVSGFSSATDFALFELTEDPSSVYDVYVAGFDASGSPGTNGVGIHHPGLDAKKIATHTTTPPSVVNDNYWRIYWDATANGHSVTEGGSSGSGLFNSDKRLIGQLFGGFLGGQPNCSDPAQDEGDYGKLSVSWDGTNTTDSRRRLRDWLDPNNTGTKIADGRSCSTPDYVLSLSTTAANCGSDTISFEIEVQSLNSYLDPVTLSVTNLPGGMSAAFSTNPVTPGATTVLTIVGANSFANGTYSADLNSVSTSGTRTVGLSLVVATPTSATLTSPTDGTTGASLTPTLTWAAASGAASYQAQVTTDVAFSNIIDSADIANTSWVPTAALSGDTDYFWRVRHVRTCGEDPWSSAFQFRTLVACGASSPFYEDFESGQPTGWTFTVTGTDANAVWKFGSAAIGSSRTNPGSGNWATYDDDAANNTGQVNTATATTPVIDLSGFSEVYLTFVYNYQDLGGVGESVTLSVTDGSATFYWNGTAWATNAAAWLAGASEAGEFNQALPSTLNLSSLSLSIVYDDANGAWAWAFGFDDFAMCGTAVPLPVTWLDFQAEATAQQTVELEWATATEQNNAYFEVERSRDGKSFESIGRVEGAGTTMQQQAYTYLDRMPNAGINYYRLRQVDYDGSYVYSDVKAVTLSTVAEDLRLYPVPTTGVLNYTTADLASIRAVYVYDVVGRLLLTDRQPDGILHLDRLQAGNYVVVFELEGRQIRRMVQRR